MKDFMKFTFASLLGVILAGVVFTVLGIVTMVGMVASSDTETVVEDNSVLIVDFEGTLTERAEENPLQELMGEEYTNYGLDDILSAIKKAKNHDNIKGIYLKPTMLGASYASLEEIRKALVDFKESGKCTDWLRNPSFSKTCWTRWAWKCKSSRWVRTNRP